MELTMTDKPSIKSKLIKQIVNRLRKFGFVHVNEINIASDEVYSLYFLKILNEMLGENVETDLVINQLLNMMNIKNKTGGIEIENKYNINEQQT